ncbi:MAG: prepilin peptidase [Acetobacteraceae bacterium]
MEQILLASWLIPVLIAPFVGSLLGVVIQRLPTGRPLVLARSRCAACRRPLGFFEMLPLISYLWLGGRCRCGAHAIGRFHLEIELAALAPPALAALAGQSGATLWFGSLLGWGLITLGWIDATTLLLPDALTLPLIPLGLFAAWWLAPDALTAHAAAAALGYLALVALAFTWRAWRGIEGLGAGDAKLTAAAGAWSGPAMLPWIMLAAALLGILLAAVLRLAGREVGRRTQIPFGPPLAAAIFAAWLLGGSP